MLDVACEAAIVVHVAFGVLFAALGLWGMALVNAGSVLLYLVALFLLRRRLNRVAVALIWLEIVGHAVIAVRLLGLDSGFQFYLLVMLPLIFVSPQRTSRMKVVLGVLLLAISVALDLTMHRIAPTYDTPAAVLDAVRVFNITTTFLVLARLAQAYFTAVQSAEARLRTMASTDPLTGALNRRSLLVLAERLVAEGESFSIVLGDVDHFKAINDLYGHERGDHVLVEIFQALHSAVRPDDDVARWGGEEFVLLLPKTSAAEATAVAERSRRAIGALTVTAGGGAAHSTSRATMTFGVATLEPGELPEACISRADAALYAGKAAGRDRVTSALLRN